MVEVHMNDHYDIIIIGGGIAGLVAAVTAAEAGSSVALFEAHALGGRAQTVACEGFHYNVGPHALYEAGHLRPWLAARGLDPAGGTPNAKSIRVLHDGELSPLTFSATGIARAGVLTARGRIRMLTVLGKLPKLDTAPFVGVPWSDWLADEPDDVAGVLRMLGRVATYGNAPSFDAAAVLDQLKLSLHGVRYLDGGWQSMVDSLDRAFVELGGHVFEHRQVLSVASDGTPTVETNGGSFDADAVIIAGLSPKAGANLTSTTVDGAENLGGSVHASVLDLALSRGHDGVVFGIDQPLYLSPHAPVAKLAPAGSGLVTLLRYTPDGEVGSPDADRRQLREFAALAGIGADDVVHERFLHRMVVANAFPSAAGGGLRGRPTVDSCGLDNVFLAGDWVGPAGLLADAASSSAETAARRAVAAIESARVRG